MAALIWQVSGQFVQRTLHMTQRKSSEEKVLDKAIGRRLRSSRGLVSQGAFAARVGVTRAALANYELGRSRPPEEFLERVSEATGIPKDEFVAAPELPDFEAGLRSLVGDGWQLTADEWALVRLLRVSDPDTVQQVVQALWRGFDQDNIGLQLADPERVVMDLYRLYSIKEGQADFQRGISGESAVQLVRKLADLGARKNKPKGDR